MHIKPLLVLIGCYLLVLVEYVSRGDGALLDGAGALLDSDRAFLDGDKALLDGDGSLLDGDTALSRWLMLFHDRKMSMR
ncbi:LOW QUALITY PROTEIN: hypothetical protein HID58_029022 [Brassica napus]|uniref:Uncharacterized protein n=1 Tax=Brassica napus TaxID=3708 RepID=A0ABQ8CBY6_BRANA|nr:LOW QUALITY PROTEIN: hypothetical protein HID58_029022 [Brassica napus]